MWTYIPFITLYLTVANVAALFLYWDDKERAQQGTWRIPERTLLLAAVFGGSIGSAIAQQVFHHKTRKLSFQNAFWTIVVIQAAAIVIAAILLFG